MNFMMNLLAETAAGADPMISGTWLVGFLGAVGTLLGIVMGHKNGKASQSVTLKNLPLRTLREQRPVSYDQHSALDARVGRIEAHLDVIQRDQASQYKQILEAGAERELRMTEVLNSGLREVHARLDAFMKLSPPNRR
jgi:hypothetical protein